ncbi:MAG: bile acid:sodium symporter [Pirellulales bacterium]|nr:bile acid:sodium symporter [Pirellulales bacterium]
MRLFLSRQWFLLSLAVLLASGLLFPRQLDPLAEAIPQAAVVALVLFLMALPLDAHTVWRALTHPRAVVLAIAISWGLLPLVAWCVAPLLRPDLAQGLLIAAALPCTMASAAVWTRRAGGNDAVALLVTISTNFFCFLATPVLLYLSTGTSVEIDLAQMVLALAVQVVLPTFAAQGVRLYAPVARFAAAHVGTLGSIGQCGILLMAWIGAVKAGLKFSAGEVQIEPLDWFIMFAAVIGLHVSMLWSGHAIGRLIGLDRADRVAVGFSGSQKTLMMGLYIAITYYDGLAMLPMIAYHVCQLLIDTVVADRLAISHRRTMAAAETPAR